MIKVAAAWLRDEGSEAAADAVLASQLAIEYLDSWSDGHDDYFYDVALTLTVPPQLMPVLERDREALRAVLGRVVSFFPDDRGDYRKGLLARLDVVSATS